MGVPENPMIITAVLTLAAPMSFDATLELVRDRLLRHERFKQRVREARLGLGTPRWEEDPRFDVRAHVRRVQLPPPGDARALESLVSELMSAPLDQTRSPWEMHLVDGFEGGSALVVRIHHVLADGALLVRILGELSDENENARAPTSSGKLTSAAHAQRRASFSERGRRVLGGVLSAARLVLAHGEPRTALSGKLGVRKHALYSSRLSLEALKTAAHAHDATLTAAFLATIAGALRERISSQDGLVLHALVPVALGGDPDNEASNHYASVFVPLPVGERDPLERVRKVHAALLAKRQRRSVSRGMRLASAAGAATKSIERLGVALFSRKASIIASVVRGPSSTVSLAGVRVTDIVVWAPPPGSIALAVTLMSYAGRVRIGLSADARVVLQPRAILETIERGLARLDEPTASSTRA